MDMNMDVQEELNVAVVSILCDEPLIHLGSSIGKDP